VLSQGGCVYESTGFHPDISGLIDEYTPAQENLFFKPLWRRKLIKRLLDLGTVNELQFIYSASYITWLKRKIANFLIRRGLSLPWQNRNKSGGLKMLD